MSSTIPIRKGEEIDLEQLNAFFLKNNLNDTISSIQQFSGGYSNLTYLLNSSSKKYVLRRPPAGAKAIKGGHDMAREYQLLCALQQAGFREIPTPLVLGNETDFLGVPFYIMAHVPGTILRASDVPALIKEPDTALMRARSENMCDKLVALHAIDIEATGLIQIGKPEGYIKRQVEGWHNRYEKAKTDSLIAMEKVAQWLLENVPTEHKPSLIHNDFKFDNVVFSNENPTEITTILDWEMTTVGDPLMDVGVTLAYWSEKDDNDFEKSFNISWIDGNLTRTEFVARYAAASGREVSNILYYYVFGLFKNAVIIQQIYSRYKAGLTTDLRFQHLLVGVKALSQKALVSIETGEMK